MRAVLLFAAIVLALSGVGNAQVAAPSILPASPGVSATAQGLSAGVVTANPAVQQWAAPSRIALGPVEMTASAKGLPEEPTYTGGFVGFSAVGEWLAVAGEGIGFEPERGDIDDTRAESGAVNLAAGLWDSLALGVGYRDFSQEATRFDPVAGDTFRDYSLVMSRGVGISLRLGRGLFLGAAGGRDAGSFRVDFDHLNIHDSFHDTRPFSMYGAALRTVMGFPLHLEYYAVHREPFQRTFPDGTTVELGDVRSSVGVVEFGAGGLVLGYRGVFMEADAPDGRTQTRANVYDLGWAPFEGFALLVHNEEARVKHQDTGFVEERNVWGGTLAWQF